MPKNRRWSKDKGEHEVPSEEPTAAAETEPRAPEGEPSAESTATAEATTSGTEADAGTEPAADAEPEKAGAPEPGPLTKLQDGVRVLFDHDQLSEIRLALNARREDLKRHEKKGVELGVSEPDARFKLEILDGTSTKFGLIKIFAPIQASETRDLFFDRESPNGRPGAEESTDETITFRTVDGRDITCHRDKLWEHAPDLRALFTAGTLPEKLEKEIKDQDFWYEIEPEAETAGAEA